MKHSNNNFSITKKTQFKKYPWNDNRYIIVIVKWLIKWVLMLPHLPRKLLKWLLKSLLMCISTIQGESTFFGFRRTCIQILSLSPVTLGSLFKLCKVSTFSSSKIGIIPPSQGFSVHMSLGFFFLFLRTEIIHTRHRVWRVIIIIKLKNVYYKIFQVTRLKAEVITFLVHFSPLRENWSIKLIQTGEKGTEQQINVSHK